MKKMNKNSKQRIAAGIALIVVVLLVGSGVFVYYYYKEEPKEETPVNVIDNRISPLENQGLVLEVLRIRDREFYDKFLSKGSAWKSKPSFYFIAEIDGLAFKSKDVGQLGWMHEILYNTWDSMFMENKIVKDAEEEQTTSTVKLTIVERVQVKSGLFKKTTQDIERDSISVVYDYRTGRWSGDDNFKDYDGYGHYLGNTFDIWFNIYQMDYDQDYIPYWTEVNVLHTDPTVDDSKLDPDGDGIPTAWEWRWGYDPFTWDDHAKLDPDIDGIENVEEYQIAKWLADPYIQNEYFEVDYMGQGSRFDPPHIIYEESILSVTEVYARHNIQLFFDEGWPDTPLHGGGDVLPHYESLSQDSGMVLQFYNHYFPEERRGIFHYLIGCHGGPFQHPAIGNVYDANCIGYSVTPKQRIKEWINSGFKHKPWERPTRVLVTQTMLHEIGHSVGLHPWSFEGVDYANFKTGKATFGNYVSAMNYLHIYDDGFLDYSDGSNGAPYDQNDWTHLFLPEFEYNGHLIEEIFFLPPGFDKIVWGETEFGVTGYSYDENLTKQYEKTTKDWSPIEPTPVNWLVFKLKDRDKYPNYHEIKIFVQPEYQNTTWSLYEEGNLDSEGKIKTYSQQDIINNVMMEIKKSK
jgi:hypothetical protein